MRALGLLAALLLPGCLAAFDTPAPDALPDVPARRPTLVGGFHNATDIAPFLDALAALRPDLVRPFVLGQSVEGRDILGVRLGPDEGAPNRTRVLLDGGLHGNEVNGVETVLHTLAWLVENEATNATARRILAETEITAVPLVSPDGRIALTRPNARGVNLNRNFDVDFGNPDPNCRSQTLSPLVPVDHAGPRALSEPESKALADLMVEVQPQIYLSHHTGRFALIRPWAACAPPFEMPEEDDAVFDAIESWVSNNTKIKNTGDADETARRERIYPPGRASGSSTDWCYVTYRCVALTLEVQLGYDETGDPIEIAETSLPINLHMLNRAAEYAAWRTRS